MNKYLKYAGVFGFLSVLVFGYQNCSNNSSDGSASTPVNTASISCESAAIVGSWNGAITGHSDNMSITANCGISSSYCSSSSIVTLLRVNTGCPSWATTCGVGTIRTSSSNGNPGCFSAGSEVQCQFATIKDSSQNLLYFNCGGATQAYSQ